MVTFVDDDVSVPGHEIIDLPLSDEALDHRHIEAAVRFTFAPAHLTHVLLIDSEEHRELRDPLVEKVLAVDEDQRAPSALRDQVGAENGLPDARRADEHAKVMRQQRVDRILLYGGEVAVEGEFQGRAIVSLIVDRQLHSVSAEELPYAGRAAAWQGDELWQILEASDDPRRRSRRETHLLLLVEFGVLEGCEPLQFIKQRRREPCLLHEGPLCEHRPHFRGQWTGNALRVRSARRTSYPWFGRLVVVDHVGEPNSDDLAGAGRFSRDHFDRFRLQTRHGRQEHPLIRECLELPIDKDAVSTLPRLVL